ncbi:SLC13 family permease [Pseudoroseomonas cervicalis]|uniref:SLC13 family permease n=1 Tax=Teichococcus cervicalis TaxID=204525 RepID=UPI002784E801|nr:SLC13 family permease [Pseudoroseomonas cervicalis]MDQ1080350.1 di/tricarboxylate transporter [Pseudoroseomonas cervicalis]
MTTDQLLVSGLTLLALAGFVLQPVRYDVVAMLLLLALVLCGQVAPEQAFLGFAEPAVTTVAAVLAITKGLQSAGTVDLLLRRLGGMRGRPGLQVTVQNGLCASFSAFMNNVGALALFMPVALRNAYREGYAPSRALMPLAFASVLGGLVTLIGTPPNLIISAIRREQTDLGPYALFDFAWVGLPIALAGIVYLLLARRLLPDKSGKTAEIDAGTYVAEARLGAKSRAIGLSVRGLEALGEGDVTVVGLFRGPNRTLAPPGEARLREEDTLLLEGSAEALRNLVEAASLSLSEAGAEAAEGEGAASGIRALVADDVDAVEAIIRPGSPLIGRSPGELRLRSQHGLNLLAVSRQGRRVADRMAEIVLRGGDVVLVQAQRDKRAEAFQALALLPLAERGVVLGRPQHAWLAGLLFLAGILAVLFELAPAHIAFAGVLVAMLLCRVLKPDEAYAAVDWPVIVLLGALFPLGQAMENSGTIRLLVDSLSGPAGALPGWALIGAIMLACMVLSEIMANNATVLLMAPIALGLGPAAGVSADAMLMAVCIGTSCTFLSPIGHQSNTLVMEPGGYRFADYPRLGAPLALLCLLIGTPLIVLVWG